MSRKSEREFVGGDMSDDDFAALNGDSGSSVSEPIEEAPQQAQDAVIADPVPDAAQAQEPAPQAEPEQKMVDIRALQEARAEIRKRDEELAKTRAEQIRIDERLNILNQALAAQNKPQQAVPATPSKDEDPLGFIDHKFETVEERLARFEQAEQQRAQAAQAEQQHNALMTRASSYIDQAVTVNPQVSEALNFAFEGLRGEIRQTVKDGVANGTVHPNMQAAETERLWRASMAQLAQRLPPDPQAAAEYVFRNARYYGWGYQSPQAVQVPSPAQQVVQVQQPTIQQRAEQQARHMSLSGVSGAEPPKPIDAKTIASMSEKEWKEFVKTTAGKKAMEEHFGGL